MPDYLDLEITTDAVRLYEDGIEAIQAQAPPGWEPSLIESWLLSAVARMGVEVAILAGQVPLRIFTYFGESVLRIPALGATAAAGTATFTLTDTLGHTIAAGAQINLGDTGFVTLADLVVAAGSSTGDIAIQAIEEGTQGNDLSGSAELVSPTLVFVTGVDVAAPTGGGVDGETGEEYANRLADELPELSPKVVLWPDAQARARRHPLVARALAINRYDPGPPVDTDAEGHISIFTHDAIGATIGATARGEIAADIMANRINGLVAHALDPTYTRVDVRFTALADPGQDPAAVEASAEQAVADFIDPARWGRIGNDATNWTDTPVLARNDLLWVVRDVPGVRRVETLTLARYGQPQAEDDVTLDGPAALPAADSVVDGTVTA